MAELELISSQKTFGGRLNRYAHRSAVLDCDMVTGVFLPPQAKHGPVPLLWWLSGLTCTDENFTIKAGAQRCAAELGIAIVCPDTSPRGTDLPGEHERFDFGSGAGFYVNATQAPWSDHYRMYDYVTAELPDLVARNLPVTERQSISGHSMGGHGALVCALKNPGRYHSVSAFAPICHPSDCPWGIRAFEAYLGPDRGSWAEWDAVLLIADAPERLPLLVEQGDADEWLDEQLNPAALLAACTAAGHPLDLRMREGYDHGYYFVATFIEDHLRYHAQALGII